jgi:hypothetical protein
MGLVVIQLCEAIQITGQERSTSCARRHPLGQRGWWLQGPTSTRLHPAETAFPKHFVWGYGGTELQKHIGDGIHMTYLQGLPIVLQTINYFSCF